jgi:tetratricopeptide (TPR) repeat protein
MKRLITTLLCLGIGICAFAAERDSAQFYFSKGLAEKQEGRLLTANKYFETALNYDNSFVDALLENAACCIEMHKPQKAKVCLEKALEIRPGDQKIVSALAQIYFDFRQFDKAVELASLIKNSPAAERILGIAFYYLEEYPTAVQRLQKYLSKEPNDVEANYILARTYLDMEDYKQSVLYYEKAISLDKTKNSRIYELGMLYFTVNDYKKSYQFFNMAAENGYPKSLDFSENLGLVALYVGEYDRGEELLLSVWKRKPNNKDILRNMAEVLYQRGQFERSLKYCQQLMELDPNDGKALYQAGMNFQKSGQKDRGQQMCDKAIEMDPSLASLRRKKEIM